MTFPATVTHYEQRAKIYRPGANFPFYRVAFKVAGQRRMMTFASYSEAKAAAEAKVKELHNGQQAAGLTAKEGHAALTIREALAHHHRDTGRKVSAVEAVTTYLAAIKLLPPGSTLLEAVRSFRENIAAVARKPLAEAVAECNADREAKTVSENGKRPQLNPVYVADTARVLRGFSTTNTALAVCDVTKDHLDLFLKTRHELSVKSRNHFRATLMMFFRWCQRPDFLSATTRLLDADGLHREEAEVGGGDGVSIFHPAVGLHPGGVGEHDVIAVILEAVPQPIPVEGGCDGDRGNTVPVGIKQLQDRRQVAGGFLVDEPRSAFVPEAAEGVVAVQVNSDPNLHCGSPVVEGLGLSLFSHLRLLTRLPDNYVSFKRQFTLNALQFLALTTPFSLGTLWVMVRKLRVEYPGAIYHVMNRGDRREEIFRDDADRERFLETLGEVVVTQEAIHALSRFSSTIKKYFVEYFCLAHSPRWERDPSCLSR